jgi:hypothetical protein
MKRFVARRVAPVVLVGTLVTGGFFVTSTPANAGIIEDCKWAFQTILGYFRAYGTAAHHEQAPDNRISWNDFGAAANGRADYRRLSPSELNLNAYSSVRSAGGLVTRGDIDGRVTIAHERVHIIQQRLDTAARHDRPDGLVSDIDLRAAIANPGAICG